MTPRTADFIASERQYLRALPGNIAEDIQRALLIRAIEQGKAVFVQDMLLRHPQWVSMNADFVGRYSRDSTMLHIAARAGNKEIVELLLKTGNTQLLLARINRAL